MRVLVVGTVPPPGGPAALALGRAVSELLAQGHEVEVLSPDLRSAAHRHARLAGIWLIIALLRAAPRSDALVLRLEQRLPCAPDAGRVRRAAVMVTLGLVLRAYRQVTLRLDSPIPIPGGLGGRAVRDLWSRTSTIVVENDDDARAGVRAVPGVVAERVVVDPPRTDDALAHFDDWEVDLAADVREEVLLLVRERARRDRAAKIAQHQLGVDEPTLPLSSAFTTSPATNPNLAGVVRFGLERSRRLAVRMVRSRRTEGVRS